MSSLKVVDLNEEAKELPPIEEEPKEATEEQQQEIGRASCRERG